MSAVGSRREGRRRASDDWVARWLAACSDLAELERSNPMTDAVIDEIDGRMIRIGDRWLADFASCNYLGFDLDREIIDAVPGYLEQWGTHPSWSRLLGSPVLYEQIEEHLAELLGAPDALVLSDDHADSSFGDPAARRERNRVRRPSRPQDDLRRRRARDASRRDAEALRARRPRRARAPAAERHVVGAADLHRRGEQHDRERRRPPRATRRSLASTTRSSTSTTRTASA